MHAHTEGLIVELVAIAKTEHCSYVGFSFLRHLVGDKGEGDCA